MHADRAYVIRQFDKYNLEIFEGRLPVPEFRMSHARSFLGRMEYKMVRKTIFSRPKPEGFRLKISSFYDLEPDMLDDVIIHEMIHYDIVWSGLKDTSSHGRIFRERMKDINRRFGRHIRISHKRADLTNESAGPSPKD